MIKDINKQFNSLNFCIKSMGLAIVFGPILFFISTIGKDDFFPGAGGIFDYYSKTIIHSTLISVPFLIIYSLVVSYFNTTIKDSILFKGATAFFGIFLLIVIYKLPVDIYFESLVQNKDMEFIYGLLIFITPFFLKRAANNSANE